MAAHNNGSFVYTKEMLRSLETTLSAGRLALYEDLTAGNSSEALTLYCWNTTMCQSLYWPLHAFEVTLRNGMADRIADQHGDDWYEKVASFAKRTSQTKDEVEHIEKAKEKLAQDGLLLGHDNIVAAVSLGFWQGLLQECYREKLWQPLFSSMFAMIGRDEAYKKVNQIKRLRNNVAHYEPIICFPKGNNRELFRDYKVILKVIRWICQDTATWVEHNSSKDFFYAWNSCPEIMKMPRLTVTKGGLESNSEDWRWL